MLSTRNTPLGDKKEGVRRQLPKSAFGMDGNKEEKGVQRGVKDFP